jgi:hypothetical protein
LTESLTLEELIATNEEEIILPSHVMQEIEDRQAAESKAAERSHPLEESKDKPD